MAFLHYTRENKTQGYINLDHVAKISVRPDGRIQVERHTGGTVYIEGVDTAALMDTLRVSGVPVVDLGEVI